MAVHVVQGRDPWWSSLAVNVLGGLWNDYQQREKNKKEAAYLGEIAKMYNGTQDGSDTAPAPAQDAGQGLLNLGTVTDNSNGWTNALHKADNPLLQFDLGTAGLAPTATTAAPAVPPNAWANALGNSGNTLAQFDANIAGIAPATTGTATTQTGRAPIVTPMDFYRSALELAGTKRFRMLNPDRVQAMLTPYMKLNEEARQEQMRNDLANDYMNATDAAGRINTVTGGALRGIVPESMATTVYNQNKATPVSFDAGGQIIYGTTDGMTGAFTRQGKINRTMTPDQAATQAYNNARLAQDNQQFYAKQALENRRLTMEGNQVTNVVTDANGVTWTVHKDGSRKMFDGQGLTAQEKTFVETGSKRLSEIDVAIAIAQSQKATLYTALNQATNETDKENIRQQIRALDNQINQLNADKSRINTGLNSILNPSSAAGQGQSTGNNGTVEQTLPPAGQGNDNNPINTLPPAVSPFVQSVTSAIKKLKQQRAGFSVADNDPALRRISDGRIYTGKMIRDIMRRADNGEFKKHGIKSGAEVINWLIAKKGFEPISPILTQSRNKATKWVTGNNVDGNNTEQLNKFDVMEANNNIPNNTINAINTNSGANNNNSSIGDFLANVADFIGLGATPAYADERELFGNNEPLADDPEVAARLQKSLDELNGQFNNPTSRWADWATGLNLQGKRNNLPEWQTWLNKFNSQANTNNGNNAPFGGMDLLDRDPMSAFNPFHNEPAQMQLLSNRRPRQQQVLSGYYVQPTNNGGKYRDFINTHAKTYGVDPDLIAAIIQQESNGNSSAVSKTGAGGLMQLMPKTASGLGVTDVFDPNQNIRGGTKYIAQLLKRYNGDIEKALWAYNAGPGNVNKGRLPDETKKYIPSVMARYRRLKGLAPANASIPKAATTQRRGTRKRRARRRRR